MWSCIVCGTCEFPGVVVVIVSLGGVTNGGVGGVIKRISCLVL